MTREEMLDSLATEAAKAAEELGEGWRNGRGKAMMAILEAVKTRPMNICLCGEGKGNHTGERNMGGCSSTGCKRYKPWIHKEAV